MADKPTDGKFDLKYFIFGEGAKDWWRSAGDGIRLALIIAVIMGVILVGINIWNFFMPKPAQNVHKPTVVVLPGAKVDKLDMSSTQLLVEDKPWEAGIGGGAITFDNKNGAFMGAWARRRW